MDDEEKKAYLIKKHVELLELVASAKGDEEKLKRRIEEQGLIGEIQGIKRREAGSFQPARLGREPILDSLARVGGFAQSQQNFPERQVERLVVYSQATAKNTQKLVDRDAEQFRRLQSEFSEGFSRL
jgi:hypothetical protein